MSMSFQTSNSGAFRSLHCLIYKVLAPSAIRSGTFTILPHPEAFVKHFFRLFSKSFSRSPSLTRAFWKAWLSYHTSQGLSTPFFSRPQLFFKAARRAAARVTVFLMNGYQLRGVITAFDPYVVVVVSDGKQQVIYKHAISTIAPEHPIELEL